MRIHHLNCGTMCPAATARLVNGREGGLLERSRIVCHCLLIETDGTLVMVDTGIGTHDVAHPIRGLGLGFVAALHPVAEPEETAVAQVAGLGFDPADVRHVVPTHLDLDHAGGLADFPGAEVHVFGAEQDAALHPKLRERPRYKRHHFAHRPRWVRHELDGDGWFGFEAVCAVPGTESEVLLIPLIGHTRGHCGVAVRSGDRWLLDAGDAYFNHEEMETPPSTPLGMTAFQTFTEVDRRKRKHNQQRLRKLVSDHGDDVTVFCAHDPWELEPDHGA